MKHLTEWVRTLLLAALTAILALGTLLAAPATARPGFDPNSRIERPIGNTDILGKQLFVDVDRNKQITVEVWLPATWNSLKSKASGFGGPVTASWYFTTIDPKAPKDYYTGTDGRKTTFSGQSPARRTFYARRDAYEVKVRRSAQNGSAYTYGVPRKHSTLWFPDCKIYVNGVVKYKDDPYVAHANTKASWTCSTRLDRIQ